MKLVKIAPLGKRVTEVSLDDNGTVGDAIEAAGEDISNVDVRINGRNVDDAHVVAANEVISLVPRVKGGIAA